MERIVGKLLYTSDERSNGMGVPFLHHDCIAAISKWLEEHPDIPYLWEPSDSNGDLRFILMLVSTEISGVGYPTWVIITYYKLDGQYRLLMGMSPVTGVPDAGTLDLPNGLNAIRSELPKTVYGSTNTNRIA